MTAFEPDLRADGRQAQQICALIEPAVAGLGLEVVRVAVTGTGHTVLQVMLDRADGSPVAVVDCEQASRLISVMLDVEDPITGPYDLEVSSPGIDRPLTRRKDFERFAGFEARIELATPIDGRRRFRGRILGLGEAELKVRVDDVDYGLPLSAIAKAKLVMSDELVEQLGHRM